jgi:peptidoglycan/xylan/chitin deacetylase (PgdA/CDA1 family)
VRASSLMYHDVVEPDAYDTSGFAGETANIYKLPKGSFRAHLEALRASPAAIRIALPTLAGTAAQPVFLTFDDGGASAHSLIAGMLEEFGWRGCFFITTGRIGTAGFVTEPEIADLQRRGHLIGSHSHSHPPRISHLSREQILGEWRDSTRRLADILGSPVTTASVPGGFYSRQVAETAAESGIQLLFTSEPTSRSHAVNGCQVFGRYSLMRDSAPALAAALAEGRLAATVKQAAVWNAKKAAKRLGGETYLRLRQYLLSRP